MHTGVGVEWDTLLAERTENVVHANEEVVALGVDIKYPAHAGGKAVDGIPQTELFVRHNGSEVEAEKLFDPSSALKLTQALQPKANAAAVVTLSRTHTLLEFPESSN